MGDKKSTTFITTEGLIAEYKLLSFFQLRNEDVKIVIFNEKKSEDSIYYGKITKDKNDIIVTRPSDSEIVKIQNIIEEPKTIRFIRLSDSELDKLFIVSFITKDLGKEKYSLLVESDLFKVNKNLNPMVSSLKEKKKVLASELSQLKREELAAKWKEVKNESRTIIDDDLLGEIEKELNKLEKTDFIEEISHRYSRTIKANYITLIIVFALFLLTSFGGALLGFIKATVNVDVFLELLKSYGRYAVILLIIQTINNMFFKKYVLMGRIFTLFGLIYYSLRSMQLLFSSPINFGFILMLVIIIINLGFGINTYSKLKN